MTPSKPILKGIDQLTATGFRCVWQPKNGVHFKIEMCYSWDFAVEHSVPGAWDFVTCNSPYFNYSNPSGLAKEYYYRVRCKDAQGNYSEWSDTYHIMTFAQSWIPIPAWMRRLVNAYHNSKKTNY